MNAILFAAAQWMELLIMVAAGVIYILAHVFRNMEANAKRPEPRPLPRPRDENKNVDRTSKAQQELEQFLREIGQKRQERPTPQAARPAQPAPQPRQPKRVRPVESQRRRSNEPQPVAAAPPSRSEKVTERHLKSSIEMRRQETMHSRLETSHLSTNIRGLESTNVPPRKAEPQRAAGGRTRERDAVLYAMLTQPEQRSRAFIIGQVLATPVGFGGGSAFGPSAFQTASNQFQNL